MNFNIKLIRENEDGSADFNLDCDKEATEFLVNEGLISIMKHFIEQNKNARDGIEMRKNDNRIES